MKESERKDAEVWERFERAVDAALRTPAVRKEKSKPTRKRVATDNQGREES